MFNFLKSPKDMNIIGQGGKIILFTLPFIGLAIYLHLYYPAVAALPFHSFLIPVFGAVLLIIGFVFWLTAIIQLLINFQKGKLIATGAYGICRNPIYASVLLFILPAIAFLTGTWVYFLGSMALYLGVVLFIKKEESKLKEIFGKEYEVYLSRVNRIFPFVKIKK